MWICFRILSLKTKDTSASNWLFDFVRCKQLLDHLKEKRSYRKLKVEALDRTLWITRFGRGYVPVVRQTTE